MSELTDAELVEIEHRAAAATPGPWFPRFLDDDHAANLVAVSTVSDPDITDGPAWPDFAAGQIVAATLIQFPVRYVDVDDSRWNENATFIAQARTDVPRLVAEIRRLRQQAEGGDASA